MKKYIMAFLITIPVLLIAWNMVDSAEGQKNTYNDTVEESVSNQIGIWQETDAEEIIIPEEAEATDEESDNELSDSDKYFLEQQEYISNISNGLCSYEKIGEDEYEITLYNKEHVKIFSELYPLHHSWVKAITGNVLEIGISVGSPARYTFYFDAETAEISDTYFNAKVFGDKYIAYMDSDVIGADEITLTLTDIFKKGILRQEIVRDFSICADPMSAVHSVEMIDDNSIRLEYCKGAEYTTVSEIIELKWTSLFSNEPITILAKVASYYDDESLKGSCEYEYDSAGNKVKNIRYEADGSVGGWSEYKYDSAGNQVKYIYYEADGSVQYRKEYEYDSLGNQVKYIYYEADGSIWYREEYEYDSAGNKVKNIHYDADGNIWYREEYEYDSAGNQVKNIRYDADDNIWYRREYKYDSTGNRMGEDLYEADGRKYSSWYEYEYDNAGNQTKSIRYASDGRVYWWREYEYDNEGNLTKIIDYSWADTTVYEYITITPHNEVTANN